MISIPLDPGIFVPCLMSGGSDSKASVYNVGDPGSISGSGRFPGEGNDNPLQYSCLENPMDGGAWCRLLSLGSQKSRTRLSDFTFIFTMSLDMFQYLLVYSLWELE